MGLWPRWAKNWLIFFLWNTNCTFIKLTKSLRKLQVKNLPTSVLFITYPRPPWYGTNMRFTCYIVTNIHHQGYPSPVASHDVYILKININRCNNLPQQMECWDTYNLKRQAIKCDLNKSDHLNFPKLYQCTFNYPPLGIPHYHDNRTECKEFQINYWSQFVDIKWISYAPQPINTWISDQPINTWITDQPSKQLDFNHWMHRIQINCWSKYVEIKNVFHLQLNHEQPWMYKISNQPENI